MNKETIIKDYQDYKKTYDSIEDKNSNAALQLMGAMNALEHLCPELKMSESEKIKKQIIGFITYSKINDETKKNWVSWLENKTKPAICNRNPHKGDKNNPYDMSSSDAEKYTSKRGFDLPWMDDEVFVDERYITQSVGNILRWADEHPVNYEDNIRSRKGYWAVIDGKTDYIIESTKEGRRGECRWYGINTFKDEHVWSISDAKPGDVLVADDNILFIFVSYDCGDLFVACNYFTKSHKLEVQCTKVLHIESVKPAHKKQRDFLFSKLYEEGYEWDAEHNQLNKIEQNHVWNEEDKMQLDAAIHLVSSTGHTETAKWLKSLKDRVLSQPKQEWNKEGENNILFLTSIIEECFKDKEKITLYGNGVCDDFTKEDVIDRLKSLRPQSAWMPTPEQVDALQIAIENAEHEKEYSNQNALVSLMEDLKKL